ncbi:MAG: dTDP-4-dehydrorhamnose 3,5-epimerase family protein, partial [Chlamydiae bacterium]|nr:dTDP-4-dehydrorhamnose 3,5-epimerase family protein [Chlamydiota bacterium]
MPHVDARGSFSRLFCQEELPFAVEQMSLSINKKKGTLRGLHFQASPHEEDKLIYCMKGSVFDVLVDLETKEHAAFELKAGDALLAPKGFAHGFLTLQDECELLYLCS